MKKNVIFTLVVAGGLAATIFFGSARSIQKDEHVTPGQKQPQYVCPFYQNYSSDDSSTIQPHGIIPGHMYNNRRITMNHMYSMMHNGTMHDTTVQINGQYPCYYPSVNHHNHLMHQIN